MKNLVSALVRLCCLLLLPALACAGTDFYLQIKDAKGEAKVVQCPSGACAVDGLAPGEYSVLVCDAQGKVIPSTVTLDSAIVSPRDLASGQSTGRRMHKPLSITMELGRGAPAQNLITIEEIGSRLAIGATPAALDVAVAKITKSRSNIQNN